MKPRYRYCNRFLIVKSYNLELKRGLAKMGIITDGKNWICPDYYTNPIHKKMNKHGRDSEVV